jgi:hypothetical protein
VAANVLVSEAMEYSVSGVAGTRFSRSAKPKPLRPQQLLVLDDGDRQSRDLEPASNALDLLLEALQPRLVSA